MQDLYETTYKIWDHLDPRNKRRPMASVAFHDSEDYNRGSLLEQAIRNYTSKNIGDLTKLNLLQFLDLPMDIVAMIVEICDEQGNKKTKDVKDLIDGLDGIGKKS